MTHDTALVTGGAGFIGRWLVKRCLADGLTVVVYDNLCAGRSENLAEFDRRVTLVEADVLDRESLARAFDEARPRYVFHLAAHHFIPYCNDHPYETIRVNAEGTYRVLEAAAAAGAECAVVASSGVLYPGRAEPLSEDEPPVVADVYGLSKRMAEEVTEYVAVTTPLRCLAARLFNTYGPFETNPHLIPHIMEALRRGRRVELGNIHTKRDYVYVEDVAELLFRCAQSIRVPYVTVNIGTGSEFSAEEVVAEIARLLGEEIAIVVAPARVRGQDKPHQIADTRRLETLTGARANHSLVDGLRKLLQHEGLL